MVRPSPDVGLRVPVERTDDDPPWRLPHAAGETRVEFALAVQKLEPSSVLVDIFLRSLMDVRRTWMSRKWSSWLDLGEGHRPGVEEVERTPQKARSKDHQRDGAREPAMEVAGVMSSANHELPTS